MQELISYQDNLLKYLTTSWYRSAFHKINWKQRLLGIKGLRGTGKTTMLLQYLKFHCAHPENALYVTADMPWFYDNTLYDLIGEWNKYGGKLLLIDEIHKYPEWSGELKVGYDGYPGMHFIFSASSAFDIFKGESDLSRRAVITELPGLSFREYLSLFHQVDFSPVKLEKIFHGSRDFALQINNKIKPLPLFEEYLETGYFPFAIEDDDIILQQKLIRVINTVLESDLTYSKDYNASNILKIKKLLGVIAGTAPFSPNISKIAERLKLGRTTVNNYLKHLEDARLLNLTYKTGKGISLLQKPDKIYFENTNLAIAMNNKADRGAMRETFLVNQLRNAGHVVELAKYGDFLVDGTFTIETGGKNKTGKQISRVPKSYLALDNIEYAFEKTIPLWLFGFLY